MEKLQDWLDRIDEYGLGRNTSDVPSMDDDIGTRNDGRIVGSFSLAEHVETVVTAAQNDEPVPAAHELLDGAAVDGDPLAHVDESDGGGEWDPRRRHRRERW